MDIQKAKSFHFQGLITKRDVSLHKYPGQKQKVQWGKFEIKHKDLSFFQISKLHHGPCNSFLHHVPEFLPHRSQSLAVRREKTELVSDNTELRCSWRFHLHIQLGRNPRSWILYLVKRLYFRDIQIICRHAKNAVMTTESNLKCT